MSNHLLPLLLLALLLPAVPAQKARHVHTDRTGARILPLPVEEGVFHFVIYGDRTGGPPEGIEVLEQAVKDTNLLGPDLVLNVGDMVQGYTDTRQWLIQCARFKRVMNKLDCRWFPVVGNHDVYWRGPNRPAGEHEKNYETHFGPLYYWFKHKNAGFVCLYSDEDDPATGRKGYGNRVKPGFNRFSPAQLKWLGKALRGLRQVDHVFLFMHHPRWLTDTYRGSNWPKVHEMLVKAGNVSGVFAGHIHRMRYDGIRDGIQYYTLATTGGAVDDWAAGGCLHHMNLVTVREKKFTVATIPVGTVIDPKTFSGEYLRDLAKIRVYHPRLLSAPLMVGVDGAVGGECAFRLANPTSRPIEVTISVPPSLPGWLLGPDHAHVRVAPGKAALVRFDCRRLVKGLDAGFTFPRLLVQVGYFGRASLVDLPETFLELPVDCTTLPAVADGHRRVLRLAGKGSCLRVDPTRVRLPDGPFTVEAWCKATALEGRRGFLAKTENSEWGIFVNNGAPDFSVHLNGRYASARCREQVMHVGRWHHVAGVFDGARVRLYVDGRLVASAPGQGQRKRNRLPFYIGADTRGNGRPMSFFEGWIDEVRVSRVARYTGERFTPALRHARDQHTHLLLHLDRNLGGWCPDATPSAAHGKRLGSAHVTEVEREAAKQTVGR